MKVRRVITYYDDECRQICRDEWQDAHGNGHRPNGPAFQAFDKDGNITEERWMLNGHFDREGNQPAHVYFRTRDGRTFPINETYYKQSRVSNTEGPAQLEYHNDGTLRVEKWMKDNYQHRADGPAEIYYNQDGSILAERWYLNGQLHRDGGPAWVDYDAEGEMTRTAWYEAGYEKPAPAKTAVGAATGFAAIQQKAQEANQGLNIFGPPADPFAADPFAFEDDYEDEDDWEDEDEDTGW